MGLSTAGKNKAAEGAVSSVTHASLHTADPAGSGANEVTGGSPAYARKAVSFGSGSSGTVTTSGSVTFDIPASTTVSHFGLWGASTAGTFYGGGALSASETFGGQGTYALSSCSVSIT